jgi:hypothetical protein
MREIILQLTDKIESKLNKKFNNEVESSYFAKECYKAFFGEILVENIDLDEMFGKQEEKQPE